MLRDSCPICGNCESVRILSPEDRRIIASRDAHILCEATCHWNLRTAHHEAGHVIAASAFAAGVAYVAICGHPHAVIDQTGQGARYLARLVISAAGDVAAAVCAAEEFIPLWSDLRRGVARARASNLGFCDRCAEARLLVGFLPQLSDLELVDVWYGVFEGTTNLFKTVSWRGALEAHAAELNDKKLLERDAIAETIEPYNLARARDEVMSKYKGDC